MFRSRSRRLVAALALSATLALSGGAALAVDGPARGPLTHVVRPGDTISAIAASYGVTAGELAAVNGLDDPDRIYIGQLVYVPAGSSGAATTSAATEKRAALSSRGAPSRLSWPLHGPITTYFGEVGPYWSSGRHPGLDIGVPLGTTVRAAGGGVVLESARSGYNSGYGNYVKIDHGGGMHTLYAHLAAVDVDPGDEIGAGEPLGTIGMTGLTTGPHLHMEVRLSGTRVDPLAYLD